MSETVDYDVVVIGVARRVTRPRSARRKTA